MNTEVAAGEKTGSSVKSSSPIFAPWNFWPCGGRKLLFGVCLEVEY